ncbi:uncharacterized protein LOC125475202 [Pyrus x bretschneideri]|uniref:uncharacterized protein LOC125475202 n=1 Tax=Pyrus x bretschneideri TaxID=225117 RepID=UPI00202DF91F|nr:uncharacterized protein LOC125475202 [Pyrus x bretschneideri]
MISVDELKILTEEYLVDMAIKEAFKGTPPKWRPRLPRLLRLPSGAVVGLSAMYAHCSLACACLFFFLPSMLALFHKGYSKACWHVQARKTTQRRYSRVRQPERVEVSIDSMV